MSQIRLKQIQLGRDQANEQLNVTLETPATPDGSLLIRTGPASGSGTTLVNIQPNGTLQATAFVGDGSALTGVGTTTAIQDDNSTNATRFLTFSDQTSGEEETLGVSSSKLTFNPSTGLLSTTALTVTGDFVVNGTTTSVNSTVTTLNDPILTLADNATSTNDSKDRGIEFKYGDGSTVKTGFFGWDNTDSRFKFIDDGTNSSEVFSGSLGTIQSGSLISDGTIFAVGEVTAADFNTTSDVNLKENIQTTSGLSVIQQLRGVEYDLKESGKHQSGVIAQEVEEVLSHIVSEKEDGTKVVAYQQIIGHLIEAVKDLKAEIDELKK